MTSYTRQYVELRGTEIVILEEAMIEIMPNVYVNEGYLNRHKVAK